MGGGNEQHVEPRRPEVEFLEGRVEGELVDPQTGGLGRQSLGAP
jgi:hypothetical protein